MEGRQPVVSTQSERVSVIRSMYPGHSTQLYWPEILLNLRITQRSIEVPSFYMAFSRTDELYSFIFFIKNER